MIVSNYKIIQIVNLLNLERKITSEDMDVNLNQMGLTSLEFVKLVLMLEDYFGIENGEELHWGEFENFVMINLKVFVFE